MRILYDSKTGNVRRFVSKLNLCAEQIEDDLMVNEPFFLITYTTGFGHVPPKVVAFLRRSYRYLCGLAASGNRNWGPLFAQSADRISQVYGVPILLKFELSGTAEDVDLFLSKVKHFPSFDPFKKEEPC